MNDFATAVVFGIGWAVCVIGGIGVGSALALWAIDRVLALTGTVNIIAQFWLAKKFPNRFKG